MKHSAWLVTAVVVAAWGSWGSGSALAQYVPGKEPTKRAERPDRHDDDDDDRKGDGEPTTFEEAVRKELGALLGGLPDRESMSDAAREAQALFDLTLGYGTTADADLMRDVGAANRMIGGLARLEKSDAKALVPFLLENPKIAETLAMAMGPQDDAAGVYGMLAKLRARFPKDLTDKDNLHGLIAAFCIVHDEPLSRPAKKGKSGELEEGGPVDPMALFAYFESNQGKMAYSLKSTPPPLLAYVVDSRAEREELEWALRTYAGNRTVGKLYSTIVYDTGAFKYGREKRVYAATDGYTLPNIRKVGGVCAEQAYFTAHVGKAIGVPAVYVSARGPDIGHAYVGYLKGGERARWDFEEGRYDDYEHIRGDILDPQTRGVVSDAQVGVLAGLMSVSQAEREEAIALTDGAARLGVLRGMNNPTFPPSVPAEWPAPRTPERGVEVSEQLALLEAALAKSPSHVPAWQSAAALSAQMTGEQRKKWADAVMTLCGRSSADFAMDVLEPMIRSVEDAAEQDGMWTWAAKQFQNRPDLAARARFCQAECNERSGNLTRAWEAYKDVIARYPNDGTVVVDALRKAENMLEARGGKPGANVDLYEDAFRRISKPSQMSEDLIGSSNFYRVGSRLADLYDKAGQGNQARSIRSRIGKKEEE